MFYIILVMSDNKGNGAGVTSLVLGLASFVFYLTFFVNPFLFIGLMLFPFYTMPVPVTGLIFGIYSVKVRKKGSKGNAIAGIVLCAINLLIMMLLFIYFRSYPF